MSRGCAGTGKPDAIIAWQPRAGRLVPNQPDAVKLTRLGDFPTHLGNMRSSDAMVVNVPAIGDTCRELGWTKPVLMISNFARSVTPVPVDRATLDTPRDAFLIAGGGRFVPRKGLDLLIRAAARVPGAWLWLIGDGKERARLEALVQSEGIAERTRFAGWVEEPIHYFAAADVVGLPSRHEPLGNIALEAWRAGVPLVATRSEGPSWFVEDGVSGLMVDIDDLDGFAAALARLRDEPALAGALVRGGRAQLEALFSERAITDAYLRVFRGDFSAVQQRPGRGE
jgi:glycosyltransferase involved in cell wall biosynthesis